MKEDSLKKQLYEVKKKLKESFIYKEDKMIKRSKLGIIRLPDKDGLPQYTTEGGRQLVWQDYHANMLIEVASTRKYLPIGIIKTIMHEGKIIDLKIDDHAGDSALRELKNGVECILLEDDNVCKHGRQVTIRFLFVQHNFIYEIKELAGAYIRDFEDIYNEGYYNFEGETYRLNFHTTGTKRSVLRATMGNYDEIEKENNE